MELGSEGELGVVVVEVGVEVGLESGERLVEGSVVVEGSVIPQ